MGEALGVSQDAPCTDVSLSSSSDDTAHLADLTAQAMLKYSIKDYDAAAELYSQATELQAEINGEMSSRNADLLYAYGRCLYHVAVNNSDVLGSKVAGEKQDESKEPSKKKPRKEQAGDALNGQQKRITEEVVAKLAEEKDGPIKSDNDLDKGNKPYFQFTGDENWDTSEEEGGEDPDEEGGADAEEEDDFVNAFEVLDLARLLLSRRLEEAENDSGKGKGESQETRQLRERLADTYDLQAEISLEGERFPNAVADLKSALELKAALFPQESSILAEAHYKLALALEFSSVTQQKDAHREVEAGKEAQVDEEMREDAAKEMEAAIASCKLRIEKEETSLSDDVRTNGAAGKSKVTKGDIEDVKEMIKEMEQRLVELRQPPVSASEPTGLGTVDGSYALNGILGSILGESPADQGLRLEEASRGAKDLTSLVKRKRPAGNESSRCAEETVNHTNGKRKIDVVGEVNEMGSGKKVRSCEGDDD